MHLCRDKFIVPDCGDKVDSCIGLSYRPGMLNRLDGRYDNSMAGSAISPFRDFEFDYYWVHVQYVLCSQLTTGRSTEERMKDSFSARAERQRRHSIISGG